MNENKPLKLKEKLIFGCGDIFGGGGQALMGVLYFYFIVNVIGISAGWAGTIVLVSKIWDAVIDPFLGVITDNARTKFGRRRPFIFIGGLLLVVAMALLWMPIVSWGEGLKIVYCIFTFIFYNTVSSVINVPYSCMSAEISTDPKETNSVNIIRLVFSTVSTAVCTLVPTIILDMYEASTISLTAFYLIIVLAFGIMFTIPLLFIGIFTRERVVIPAEKSKVEVQNFYKPLKVKGFRQLLGLYLSQSISMDILSNGILLFALYCVEPASSTVMLGIFIGVQLIMFPIINKLVNKVDKNKIYYTGLPVALIGIVCVGLYPADWPVIGLYVATAVLALGFAGAQLTSWIIFPDAVNAGELRFNERNTGSYSGIMTFCRTTASAVGIWAFGMILEFTGYVEPVYPATEAVQPASAVLGIRLVMLVCFFVLMAIGYIIARKFVLTKTNNEKIRKYLELQHDNKLESLNETDKKEFEELKKVIF